MQNPFRTLTPAEMLSKQLDESIRHRIGHQASAEEHAAWVDLLDARIARIRNELQAMTTQENKDPTQ